MLLFLAVRAWRTAPIHLLRQVASQYEWMIDENANFTHPCPRRLLHCTISSHHYTTLRDIQWRKNTPNEKAHRSSQSRPMHEANGGGRGDATGVIGKMSYTLRDFYAKTNVDRLIFTSERAVFPSSGFISTIEQINRVFLFFFGKIFVHFIYRRSEQISKYSIVRYTDNENHSGSTDILYFHFYPSVFH